MIYTLHIGSDPDSPELERFDEYVVEAAMDAFQQGATKWGRKGLGIIEKAPDQYGYDLHVHVMPENSRLIYYGWIWHDAEDWITNWRIFHPRKLKAR